MNATQTTDTKPHHPNRDVPGEFDPGAPPVEPDEGPVPAMIPDDPEHDRVIDPAESAGRREQESLQAAGSTKST